MEAKDKRVRVLAGQYNRAYHEAIKDFINNGHFPESDEFFLEKDKDFFNWIRKVVDGRIKNDPTVKEYQKRWSLTWIIGDRINNHLNNGQFDEADALIENLHFVSDERANYYTAYKKVVLQSFSQLKDSYNEESGFAFQNATSPPEGKNDQENPWTKLFRQWDCL